MEFLQDPVSPVAINLGENFHFETSYKSHQDSFFSLEIFVHSTRMLSNILV